MCVVQASNISILQTLSRNTVLHIIYNIIRFCIEFFAKSVEICVKYTLLSRIIVQNNIYARIFADI